MYRSFILVTLLVTITLTQDVKNYHPCPHHPNPVDIPNLAKWLTPVLSQLEYAYKKQAERDNLVGMATVIFYRDNILFSLNYGYQNRTSKVPINENTFFRIGSVTKVFTSLLALKLSSKGVLNSLDDLVSKVNPKFAIVDPFHHRNGSDISFRHLLTYTSGLPRETPCDDFSGACVNRKTDEILEKISKLFLIHPPGSRSSYSNLAFALAGNIITDKTNTSFGKLLEHEIIRPLGLSGLVGCEYTPEVMKRLAVGYTRQNPHGVPFIDFGWAAPSAQMYATAEGLARFIMALDSSNTQLLLPSLIFEYMQPQFFNPDGQSGFGLGWQFLRIGDYFVLVKGGTIPGYNSLIAYFPELRLGFVSLITGGDSINTGAGLLTMMYEMLIPPMTKTMMYYNQPVLPPNAKDYIGEYEAIFLRDGILIWQTCLYFIDNSCETKYMFSLTYHEKIHNPAVLQIANMLDNNASCMKLATMAFVGEWLHFDLLPNSGGATAFALPGLFPDLQFKKLKSEL